MTILFAAAEQCTGASPWTDLLGKVVIAAAVCFIAWLYFRRR